MNPDRREQSEYKLKEKYLRNPDLAERVYFIEKDDGVSKIAGEAAECLWIHNFGCLLTIALASPIHSTASALKEGRDMRVLNSNYLQKQVVDLLGGRRGAAGLEHLDELRNHLVDIVIRSLHEQKVFLIYTNLHYGTRTFLILEEAGRSTFQVVEPSARVLDRGAGR